MYKDEISKMCKKNSIIIVPSTISLDKRDLSYSPKSHPHSLPSLTCPPLPPRHQPFSVKANNTRNLPTILAV